MLRDEIFNLRQAKRRVLQHESECRGAATYLCNLASTHVVIPCGRKKCIRRQCCMGPMRVCEHSVEPIFLLNPEGFEIFNLPYVPACVANSDFRLRRRFEALRRRFRKALSEEHDCSWPAVATAMKALGWNRRTFTTRAWQRAVTAARKD